MEVLYDCRLNNISTMMITGPSLSGKTFFTKTLIENDMILFEKPFKQRFWYCHYMPLIEERISNVVYKVGLPDNFDHIPNESLIILDDLMTDSKDSQSVTNLIIRGVHHRKLMVIILTQNLFQDSNQVRTRNLNTHYLVLFKNPRNMQQINHLQRQMFPKDGNFLVESFLNSTEKAHGYLFIDLHQTTNDLIRVRSNILPHEKPMKCYIPNRMIHKL